MAMCTTAPGTTSTSGARPLVSLKSSVKLDKQEDGTYLIVDQDASNEIQDGNETWAQTHTETITITDADSGLATGAEIKYGWSTSSEVEPSTWETVELTGYEAGANTVSIEVTQSEITGKYYLWVKPVTVEDIAGNAQTEDKISTNQYWFDNTAPTVTALQDVGTITITMTEAGSGLASNQGRYFLSTSSEALLGGEWTDYTSGEPNEISIDLTGAYYLFVETVNDNVGNASTQYGTIVTIDNTDYHMFGPYKFDNVNPTVTITSQENKTWSKEHVVVVTLADSGGLATGAELQYAWSLDGENEPTDWETTIVTGYASGDKSVSASIENSTLTGKYYLWVKPKTVQDTTGNKAETATLKTTGQFYFDNTMPELVIGENGVNGNPVWAESHSEVITITDAHSGLAEGAKIQYGWSADTTTNPSSWTDATLTGYEEGDQTASIAITESEITGQYYLWVRTVDVKDLSVTGGNVLTATEKSTEKYWFDNTLPTVTATESLGSITITMADSGSGLATEQGKYYLSVSNRELSGGRWIDYTSATAYEITNITGTYYLFVEKVADNVGNLSEQYGTLTTINEVEYHMFGPYLFDNTAPTFEINPTENEAWAKEHSVTITIADETGLAAGAELQYAWSTNNETEPTDWETLSVTGYEQGATEATATITRSELTGTYYLWLKPVVIQDTSGNTIATTATTSGTFLFDNTAPVITIGDGSGSGNPVWSQSHTETITITDNNSGLAEGAELQYGWSESTEQEPTEWQTSILTGYADGATTATLTITETELTGKYHLWVKPVTLKDIALEDGNTQTRVAKTEGEYWFDKTAPTVTATPQTSTVSKQQEVTITLEDGHSGLASEQGEYFLSSSQEELLEGEWKEYTNNTAFTIGEGLTGTYYLWVKPVTDTVGNVSTLNGTIKTIGQDTYHTFGPYVFDNTVPTVTITADKESPTNADSVVYTFTFSEDVVGFTSEDIVVTGESGRTFTQVSGKVYTLEVSNSGTCEQVVSIATGVAQDTSGNGNLEASFTMIIDRTAPSVTFNPNTNTTWESSQTTTVTIEEVVSTNPIGVGINKDTLKYVWLQSSAGTPTVDRITETLVIDGTSVTTDSETGRATKVVRPITKDADSGSDWVLWVYAEDTLGNSNIVKSGVFYLDNTIPTVTVAPTSSETTTRTQNITITLADEGSGLASLQGEYFVSSKDNALADGEWKTYSSAQAVTIGDGLTGTYYLFVKTISDNAGNASTQYGTLTTIDDVNYHRFGPYTFDNTAPTVEFAPNGNEKPERSQSTVVTVTDPIGVNSNTLKYVWTESEDEPADSAFTNSFASGETITLDGIQTGGRYLWVMASDNLGNTIKIHSNIFNFDNIKPVITVEPSSVTTAVEKIPSTVITVTKNGTSGLATTNEYKYYLSSSAEALVDGEEKTYESDVAIPNLGEGLTGTYYLFVKQLSDVAGNVSETSGTLVDINGTIWHRFGEYVFDNTVPEVTFGTNGSTTWSQEHTTTVTLADAPSGLNQDTFKYMWTRSETAPTNWSNATAFTNGAEISSTEAGEEGELRKSGSDWRLWIYAEDNLGHALITSTNPFYLDNLKPIIEVTPDTNPENGENENVVKELQVTINVNDPLDPENSENLSGLKENNVYEYYLSTKNNALEGGNLQTYTPGTPFTIGTGETGVRYLFAKTIYDNANNESGDSRVALNGEQYQLVGTYIFDNTAPTITFTPNENAVWAQEQSAVVTIEDQGVAGVDGSTLKYKWIQGTQELTEDSFSDATSFSNGDTISITEVTGNDWYLWVISKDNLGNTVISKSGAFSIDNTIPEVQFTPNGNTDWATSHSTIITVSDAGAESVDGGSLKYKWVQGSQELTEADFADAQTFSNGDTITKDQVTGNDWHLWILAKDSVGNVLVARSEAFYLDNTKPILSDLIMKLDNSDGANYTDGTWTSHEVYIAKQDGTDEHSGHASTVYNVTGTIELDNQTEPMILSSTGTYTITVTTTDAVGNTVTSEPYTIKVDTTTPTVSSTISAEEGKLINGVYSRAKFTIIVAEEGSGLSEANSYQYFISSSDSELIDSDDNGGWNNYTSGNEFEIGSNIKLGTRYIFVKSVKDNVERQSSQYGAIETIDGANYHRFGPYNFDNTAPVIEFAPNGNDKPEQSQSTTVTVTDEGTSSGIKADTLKYIWTETEAEPADSEFVNTFTSGETLTIDGIEVDGRFLWVMASDNLGNTTKIRSNIFKFDNLKPTISVSPDSQTTALEKIPSTTITVIDTGEAGVAATEITYYLSSGLNTLENGEEITTPISGEVNSKSATIANLGQGLTGTYYLFVKQVADEANNVSIANGTLVDIEGEKWHRFGPYVFDNTIPEVTFGTDGNTTWSQEHSTSVTLQDIPAGLNQDTFKYQWTQSDVAPTDWSNAVAFVNGATISSVEAGKEDKTGNDWRLWIYAEDNLGHALITSTNPFYIDNTVPSKVSTITMKLDNAEGTINYINKTWTDHDVYIALNNDGEDEHSGVKETTYTVNGGPELTNPTTLNHTGIYEIIVTTTDNVGEKSSETYTVKIDKDAPTAPNETMLTMKLDEENGTTSFINDTWTNHSVYIELNDSQVTDAHSGYLSTVYSVTKDGTEILSNQTEGTTLIDTGVYVVTVTTMDKAGETYSEDGNITVNTYTIKIDKVPPIAPSETTLTMKLDSDTGAAYVNDTWTNHDVYIAKVDGTDDHSGHLSTVYSVSKDGTEIISNKTEATTLTETGVYEITVTTMDKSGETYSEDGNITVNTYTVRIDKDDPTPGTVTMNLDNDSGATYTSNTLTNHDVYIALNDGSDAHSGHLKTTYAIYYMGSNNSEETDISKGTLYEGLDSRTEPITLSTTGRYIVVVTTEDMSGNSYSEAGNKSTNTYIVILDHDLPTISITPTTTTNADANNYVKEQQVTLTVAEIGVGLDSNNAYEYCLVLDENADGIINANDLGNWATYQSGTEFTIGRNLTGTYYLVTKTIADSAGNISTQNGDTTSLAGYHIFGPYKFDNTTPNIIIDDTEHGEYKQVHTPTVTITDNNSSVSPDEEAGVNTNTLKYQWIESSEVPTEESFDTATYKGSFTNTNSEPINTPSEETGENWYLWILAKDNLGNTQITGAGPFYLDNTLPTIQVNPDTTEVIKNTNVTITITDANSGLNDTTNSYEYYLSTSNSALTSESEGSIFGVPQSLTAYTLGAANANGERTATINIGSTETGTRYLFIKAVKDQTIDIPNESALNSLNNNLVTIDGINYHVFGPYEFDNIAPKTTSFNPTENTTPAQSQSVIVTIEDQGLAGLNAGTFKYLWIQSSDIPKTHELDSAETLQANKTAFDTAYEQATHKGTFTNGGTVTISGETGNDWYLWISAEDNFGYRFIDGTGPYYLDNTKPEIHATPDTNPENGENQNVVKEITVTLTYTDPLYGVNDELAGIRDDNTYTYYLSTSNNTLAGGNLLTVDPTPSGTDYVKTGTVTIGAGETGVRYLFVRTIFDKANNESSYIVTDNGIHYELVGTYIFDNTGPAISFNPDGNTQEWLLEHTTDVTVQENVETGNSSNSGSDSSSTSGITADTLTTSDYGGYVTNYVPTNGVNDEGIKWRIFHTDGENIYLIADSYVPVANYVPEGYRYTRGTYGFDLYGYQNYNGTSDIDSNIASKWLSKYTTAGYTATNTEMNGKATAYLLDTNAWSGFKDSTYSDYAVGGPTIELFAESYNVTHEIDIETQVTSTGYQVAWSGGSFASYLRGLNTSESLYVISNTFDGVYGMWLASPSAISTGGEMQVYCGGRVGDEYGGYIYGDVRRSPASFSKI